MANNVLMNLYIRLRKEWGYSPTITEVYDLYTQGELVLSSVEENALIKEYEEMTGKINKIINNYGEF